MIRSRAAVSLVKPESVPNLEQIQQNKVWFKKGTTDKNSLNSKISESDLREILESTAPNVKTSTPAHVSAVRFILHQRFDMLDVFILKMLRWVRARGVHMSTWPSVLPDSYVGDPREVRK